MKLRLTLTTTIPINKEISIKFNIAPSKQIGLSNFINLALSQDKEVSLSFEKISTSGEREESKIYGNFVLQGKEKDFEKQLKDLEQDLKEVQRKKQKQSIKKKGK